MKGLGVKEVLIKDILTNKDIRLESEFYIASENTFNNIKGINVEESCQYGTSKELNEEGRGYPVLRLNEFDSCFISSPAKYCDLIDEPTYETLRLKKDDVLICRTNGNPKYVGKAALVPKNYDYAFASYLFRVRPKRDIINSATLVTFLNSRYGRIEIEKYSMVGNQSNFSPAKFREISIPIFPQQLNNAVENNVYDSFTLLEKSKVWYNDAEKVLLKELGLLGWQPNNNNTSIKRYTDVLSSGRLDAEYYQPKYDDYIRLIKSYKGGTDKLHNICNINDKNFNPSDDTEYKYIELSNIGNSGEITDCTTAKGADLPSRARRLVHTNDVIVSSIEGSLQSVAIVTEDYNNSICSTGFYVVKSQSINPETLLVLFKLEPMQNILKQNCSGTILTAINRNELQNIIIPKIRKEVQKEIANNIQRSITLRKEAKQLLEDAKNMVEQEIEKGL